MHGCAVWCASPSFSQVSHVGACPAAGCFKSNSMLLTNASVKQMHGISI